MNRRQTGSVLVVALLVLTILVGASASLLSLALARSRESTAACASLEGFYNAEAGISISMAEITSGSDMHGDGLGVVSGPFGRGQYSVTAVQSPENTWTLTSTGTLEGYETSIEVVLGEKPCGPFQNSFGRLQRDPDHLSYHSRNNGKTVVNCQTWIPLQVLSCPRSIGPFECP